MNKICINCKFFIPFITSDGGSHPEYAKCSVSNEVDPVTGGKKTEFCQISRRSGKCGPDGNLFEPK